MKKDILYTVAEVAEALCVSARTVYRLLETGELPHFKIGGSKKITAEHLAKYLRKAESD